MVNDVPNLFRPTAALYATCSSAGCWVYFLANAVGVGAAGAQGAAVVVIVALRMAALRWSWSLPAPPA